MAYDAAGFAPITAPVVETNVQTYIREARERLQDPKRWIKGELCTGDAFCILGALRKHIVEHGYAVIYGAEGHVENAMYELGFKNRANEIMPGAEEDQHPIANFNDHRHTRHADVLAVLDRAYALAGSHRE